MKIAQLNIYDGFTIKLNFRFFPSSTLLHVVHLSIVMLPLSLCIPIKASGKLSMIKPHCLF